MGEKIRKYMAFLKPSWIKHYLFWIIIFLIFIVFTTVILIPDSNFYARVIIVAALIFYLIFGHFFALYTLGFVKNLFNNVINLNNYSYGEFTPVRKLPALLIVLPVYLIIFQTYFIVVDYSFIEALIFGWLVLLFVRSSHYADAALGADIGKIIGSFFIPFGFIIVLVKGASFCVNLSTNKDHILSFISPIIIFH